MTRRFSRRDVLKAAGAAAGALAASPVVSALAAEGEQEDGPIDFWYDETISFNELYDYPPLLGRVEAQRLRILEGPNSNSDSVRNIYLFYVMPIYGAVRGNAPYPYLNNDIWFVTNDGYVHSSYVVPCREQFNEPVADVGGGFWGEVTVPKTYPRLWPALDAKPYDFRAGYGTTFRVTERADDAEGRAWYRLEDDLDEDQQWWVPARNIRPIARQEFAPISTHVEDKRVEIDTGGQTLTAFENGYPVFRTRISSGTGFADDDGNYHDFFTTYGDWSVQRKRPSRHMVGGEAIGDIYNLPGVPWDTYFTFTGSAIHGTYWHNDFGRDRSHGCINVTHDAAKWLYRWTQPYVDYDDVYRWTESGERSTPVIVF